jgi:hypothetical protein
LRRLYLELLQKVWQGWTIRWAHDGILDLADYVGISRTIVETSDSGIPLAKDCDPSWLAVDLEYVDTIGSIRLLDGSIRLFPLNGAGWGYFEGGISLVNVMQKQQSVAAWKQPADRFPRGGFHIDVESKRLSIWEGYSPGIDREFEPYWPGWEIDWLKDNFEAHIALTENRLVLDLPSDSDLLSELESTLIREDSTGSVASFLDFTKTLRQEDQDVRFNPNVLYDTPQNLDADFKRKTFDAAVEAWRATKKDD